MSGRLSDGERASILAALSDAPDHLLIDMLHNMQAAKNHKMNALGLIGGGGGKASGATPGVAYTIGGTGGGGTIDKVVVHPSVDLSKFDKKPKGAAAQKIGSETKAKIMERLVKPHTPDEVNGALRRPDSQLDATESLLILLFERGEVLFNGEEYVRK